MNRQYDEQSNSDLNRQKGQRRRDVKRRKRRRRGSNALIYAMLIVLLLGVFAALSLTVLFRVDTINAADTEHYSAQQIIAASGLGKDTNLFLADTKTAEQNIQQRLPYICDVKIRRSLPGTVSIETTEGAADTAYAVNGEYVLAKGGKALEKVADKPDLLLVYTNVSGTVMGQQIEIDDELASAIGDTVSAAQNSGFEKMTELRVFSAVDICAVYDNRILMQIGTVAEIDKKLANAKKIIQSAQVKYGISVQGTINLKWLTDGNDSYFSRGSISPADESSQESTPAASSAPAKSTSSGTTSTANTSGNSSAGTVSSGTSSAKTSQN